MCITAAPAELSKTVVAAWQGQRKGKIFHGLGYQNQAQSLVHFPRDSKRPGNAMAFAIPAVAGSLTQYNFIDTTKTPRMLDDMVKAAKPPTLGFSFEMRGGTTRSFDPKSVLYFNVGMYAVFVSESPLSIPAEIERRANDGSLPVEKAPDFSGDLLSFYATEYPGWPVVLFCFSNKQEQKSQPVLVVYEPSFPSHLYAPAVDCHTGLAPDLYSDVEVDHQVIFGVQETGRWLRSFGEVIYTDSIDTPTLELLPRRVLGRPFAGYLPNGDFVSPVADVLVARENITREKPSFWKMLSR